MRRIVSRLAVATLAATLFAQVASAQVFAGTTVGGPTWNRPLNGSPPDGLSRVGTDVGVDYFLVTTGYPNSDAGAYELQTSGPGTAFVPGGTAGTVPPVFV